MYKRKATEILIDLEDRIKIVEKRIQNSENLLKIMLGRLNTSLPSTSQAQVPTVQPESQVINKDNFENRPKTSKFMEAAAREGIKIDEPEPQRITEVFTARPPSGEPIDHDDMVESPIRGNVRGQRGPKLEDKKCSVSQVLSHGESPLFLANIEVLNEEGVLINQARTNTKGRWLMALAPGNYQVHVSKRFPPDSGKLSIDMMYPINIPPSDKPMELDPLLLTEPQKG
jgi:hypothetical protein